MNNDRTVVMRRVRPDTPTTVLRRVTDEPPPVTRPPAVRVLRYTIPIAAGTTDAFCAAGWGGYQTWTWAATVAALALTIAAVVALIAGWWE